MIEVHEVEEVSEAVVEALNRLVPQLSSSASRLGISDLKALVDDKDVRLLVAVDAETHEIKGTLTLVAFAIPSGKRAWIEDVIVDQGARGSGLGRLLVNEAIIRAKALGVKTIDLTSRPSRMEANALYVSTGFRVRQTNVYRFSIE